MQKRVRACASVLPLSLRMWRGIRELWHQYKHHGDAVSVYVCGGETETRADQKQREATVPPPTHSRFLHTHTL